MISRERMVAAGWGAQMIDDVLAADAALADGTADSDVAYWLRDAFWQVAWALEGSVGRHGVYTDAAYLYAAVAAGGVPTAPAEVASAMVTLRAQYDQVLARLDELAGGRAARNAERDRLTEVGRAWDRHADAMAGRAQPHLPWYLGVPGSGHLTGTAWVRMSLARADIRAHTAALRQASEVHRANAERGQGLLVEAQNAAVEVQQLGAWVEQAKVHQAGLQGALAEYETARKGWRDAVGRLLVDARAAGDFHAVDRVEAVAARYGPSAADVPGGLAVSR